jgi:uncharacterized membrane protein (DUF2068 family)
MTLIKEKGHLTKGIRVIALFEGAKGLLVMLVGFGLLELVHRDLHLAAEQIVRHLHMNPARHYPMIFIDAVNHLTDGELWAMAFSALFYSVARFAEAVGLWLERQWAEWFGVLTGGMYIPVELFELLRGITWPKVIVLFVNAVIVAYLAHVLYRSGQQHKNRLS